MEGGTGGLFGAGGNGVGSGETPPPPTAGGAVVGVEVGAVTVVDVVVDVVVVDAPGVPGAGQPQPGRGRIGPPVPATTSRAFATRIQSGQPWQENPASAAAAAPRNSRRRQRDRGRGAPAARSGEVIIRFVLRVQPSRWDNRVLSASTRSPPMYVAVP